MTLHPEDAKVVREHLGEHLSADGWRIVEDAMLLRGGCLLRTAATQVDATVAARWRHLATALGQDAKWLD
jgi:flagellar assembly protein FliH